MCTILSICLVNYIYRHELDTYSDYMNSKEALLCTICCSAILEVVTRCGFKVKKKVKD